MSGAVLVAQYNVGIACKRAAVGDDAHKPLRQHLEQMLVEQRADLDAEPRLLAHLADERRAMVLARIWPTTRQVPLPALVRQQQHAALVQYDGFDGGGVIQTVPSDLPLSASPCQAGRCPKGGGGQPR